MQFDITGSAKRIEARTSERLSFDNPKHNAYRWELARRLATLAVGKGEMLHASYCGPDDPGL